MATQATFPILAHYLRKFSEANVVFFSKRDFFKGVYFGEYQGMVFGKYGEYSQNHLASLASLASHKIILVFGHFALARLAKFF
jgi:hypothetical protein